MPYKDREAERKASKLRMQKMRGRNKGVTKEGVTSQGVTKISNTIEVDVGTAAKLLMIANSLDKPYRALDGKTGSLGDLVRYGVLGPTMTQVKEGLE